MRGHLPVAERRRQLIDAAQLVARRDGIVGVTVRAVAEQAGVAPGLVHYCFEDKKALLAALSQRLVEQNTFGGALPEALDDWLKAVGVDDFGQAVELCLQALWQEVSGNRDDQLLTYELMTVALRDRTALPAARTQFQLGQEAAERLLRVAAGACSVAFDRPIADLAAEGLSWFDGIVLRWLVDDDDAQAQRRLAALSAHLNASTVTATNPIEVGG